MKRILLAFVWFYRNAVSPYTRRSCRFTPTCSEYAMEALNKYGAFKGLGLSLLRVLRCNPFCKGGYDPVP
ncbi:MAG: membrane protein insertion efficiency factor YidD [Christensenellales bacterium]